MRPNGHPHITPLIAVWLEGAKYTNWHFTVRAGAFYGAGGATWVYTVDPSTVFGCGKGTPVSQTRRRF